MSIGFPKPKVRFDYDADHEISALRAHKRVREIPAKDPGRLLLATWNIANLGVQQRREQDYRLIAEMLGWFDLIAVQECNDHLAGLRGIQAFLPDRFRVVFSDPGGNQERYVFLYDSSRVEVREEVGEVTQTPRELAKVKLPGISQAFAGFDRNPYLASFRASGFDFVLANVHLYFGEASATSAGMDRRCLEAFAIACWAEQRHRDANAYSHNILALGDFNIPKDDPGDRVFAALTRKGLRKPAHSTKVGSNLKGDQHYDQMALLPGAIDDAIVQMGVFDYDTVAFADLWGTTEREHQVFRGYTKYYLSDHRPLWAELDVSA